MTDTLLANLANAERDLDTTLRLIDDWSAVIEDPNIPPEERASAEHYMRRLWTLASGLRTAIAELKRPLSDCPEHGPYAGPTCPRC